MKWYKITFYGEDLRKRSDAAFVKEFIQLLVKAKSPKGLALHTTSPSTTDNQTEYFISIPLALNEHFKNILTAYQAVEILQPQQTQLDTFLGEV